jgi:cysteine desulfurase/selenocysteine lyase
LLALTHVSNVTGVVNPIKEIVEIKNEVSPETRIFVDAAQSVPHIPVDVQNLGIDFLAFSGHKVYAPTGIGVLWAKEQILEEMNPYKYGGGMIQSVDIEDSTWSQLPGKFEGGTPNIAGAIGLGESLKFLSKIGFKEIINYENNLTGYLLKQLSKLDKIEIYGPETFNRRTGVISIGIKGTHPHDIAQILDGYNVAVRAGHHCNQILMKHVLKVPATTRISLGIYNDEKDINQLIVGLKEAIKILT